MKRLSLILLPFLVTVAFAISYRVVDEALSEDVASAFGIWLELVPELEIEESEEADQLIDSGDAARFGPDTFSLTVKDQSSGELTVVINPSKTEERQRVLLHETGLLLGLTAATEGVMNPLIDGEDVTLGDLETTKLDAILNTVKEDVNLDGAVNFYDLVDLSRAFGQRDINNNADINEDGVVDEADLEALRAAYTFEAPSQVAPTTVENDTQFDEFEPVIEETDNPDDAPQFATPSDELTNPVPIPEPDTTQQDDEENDPEDDPDEDETEDP